MNAVDPGKRHSLRWAWTLLIPIILGAVFCITFGPYFYSRGLAARLQAQGVRLTTIFNSNTSFDQVVRTIPGFKSYGFKIVDAFVECGSPTTRTELPQIARDLRSLNLLVDVDLSGSPNLSQDLQQLQTTRIASVTARDCHISSQDLKLLQDQRDLTELVLTDCKLDEAAFQELGRLKSLQFLALDGSSITDEGLKHFKDLKELINLGLSNTHTSDGAKEALLKDLPNLQFSDD